MQFHCPKCKILTEETGTKREYNSSVYGPCFKYVAICPKCNNEIDEYRVTGRSKQDSALSAHSCGGCCCNN